MQQAAVELTDRQRRAVVEAGIVDRVNGLRDIEDDDAATIDGDNFSLPGRQLIHRINRDKLWHFVPNLESIRA